MKKKIIENLIKIEKKVQKTDQKLRKNVGKRVKFDQKYGKK